MAIREDLVISAVSFLHEPSVVNAPLEKKVAFLESKNLTKEEIDAALARAGDPSTGTVPAASSAPVPYNYGRPPAAAPYGAYQGYWPQPPPPELPKRDWRDWFIMATVLGGVGYGLSMIAKRYILPKIAPPTPEQLTQDKSEIDASFEKAFTLLDQLNADTTALKTAEESRTQRLDTALVELESVLSSLKEQDRKREDDARRNADEIRSLRDLIPQALDAQKRTNEDRLKDLGNELKSLKTLVGNRMQMPPPAAPQTASHRNSGSGANNAAYGASSSSGLNGAPAALPNGGPVSPVPTSPVKARESVNLSSASGNSANASTSTSTTTAEPAAPAAQLAPAAPERAQSTSPFSGRFGSGKAAIPAWQMAAAKKDQETAVNGSSSAAKQNTAESGTVADAGSA